MKGGREEALGGAGDRFGHYPQIWGEGDGEGKRRGNLTVKAKQILFGLVWFLLSPHLKPSYFTPNLEARAAGSHEPIATFSGRTASFGPAGGRTCLSGPPGPPKHSPVQSLWLFSPPP